MKDINALKQKILLTGAAGGIGSAFLRAASENYLFRLADLKTAALSEAEKDGHEVITLDAADLEACQRACQGIDTVVHLAADPNPAADFYGSLLRNNIQGTYNIFRAAKDQGCRRVIFASSIQTVIGYPRDVQVHPGMPVRPLNMYGVSKCFGEAVAAYFAFAEGLSCIAIRIGAYDLNEEWRERLRQHPDLLDLSGYVSARDLNQLLMRCVEIEDVDFAIVHGISDNTFKRIDITSTRELLGYAPQDDAFALFANDLPAWLNSDVKKD